MKLEPVGRNVLIEPDPKPEEKVSEGGIVLVEKDEPLERLVYGTVLAVGNGGYGSPAWDGTFDTAVDEKFIKPDPSLVGRRVCYKNLQSHSVEHEGRNYDVIDVDGIIALCNEESHV